MENLARYIIRTSFSQEKMTYVPEEPKVVYKSKDGKKDKIFDALEWLAAMTSHVPNKGKQSILEPEGSPKEYRKNWARTSTQKL